MPLRNRRGEALLPKKFPGSGGTTHPPKHPPKDPVRDSPGDPGHGTPPVSGGGGGGDPVRDSPSDPGHGTSPTSGGGGGGSAGKKPNAEVIRRQQALRRAGYTVAVDGLWGPQSAAAWAAYIAAKRATAMGAYYKAHPPAIVKPPLDPLVARAQDALEHAQQLMPKIDATGGFGALQHVNAGRQRAAHIVADDEARHQIAVDTKVQLERIVGPDFKGLRLQPDLLEAKGRAGALTIHDIDLLHREKLLDVRKPRDVRAIQYTINHYLPPKRHIKVTGQWDEQSSDGLRRAYTVQQARDYRENLSSLRRAFVVNGVAARVTRQLYGHAITDPGELYARLTNGGPSSLQLQQALANEYASWRDVDLLHQEQMKRLNVLGFQPVTLPWQRGHRYDFFAVQSILANPDMSWEDRILAAAPSFSKYRQDIFDFKTIDRRISKVEQRMAYEYNQKHRDPFGDALKQGWQSTPGTNYVEYGLDQVWHATTATAEGVAGGLNYLADKANRVLWTVLYLEAPIDNAVWDWLDRHHLNPGGFHNTGRPFHYDKKDAIRRFVTPHQAWIEGNKTVDEMNPWLRTAFETAADPLNLVFGLGLIGKTGRGLSLLTGKATFRAIDGVDLAFRTLSPERYAFHTAKLLRAREFSLAVHLDGAGAALTTSAGADWFRRTRLFEMATRTRREAIQDTYNQLADAHVTISRASSLLHRYEGIGITGDRERELANELIHRVNRTGEYLDQQLSKRVEQGLHDYRASLSRAAPDFSNAIEGIPTSLYSHLGYSTLSVTGNVLHADILEAWSRRWLLRASIIEELGARGISTEALDRATLEELTSAFLDRFGQAELDRLSTDLGSYYAGGVRVEWLDDYEADLSVFSQRLRNQILPSLDEAMQYRHPDLWVVDEASGRLALRNEEDAVVRDKLEEFLGYRIDDAYNEAVYVPVRNPAHYQPGTDQVRFYSENERTRLIDHEIERRVRSVKRYAEMKKRLGEPPDQLTYVKDRLTDNPSGGSLDEYRDWLEKSVDSIQQRMTFLQTQTPSDSRFFAANKVVIERLADELARRTKTLEEVKNGVDPRTVDSVRKLNSSGVPKDATPKQQLSFAESHLAALEQEGGEIQQAVEEVNRLKAQSKAASAGGQKNIRKLIQRAEMKLRRLQRQAETYRRNIPKYRAQVEANYQPRDWDRWAAIRERQIQDEVHDAWKPESDGWVDTRTEVSVPPHLDRRLDPMEAHKAIAKEARFRDAEFREAPLNGADDAVEVVTRHGDARVELRGDRAAITKITPNAEAGPAGLRYLQEAAVIWARSRGATKFVAAKTATRHEREAFDSLLRRSPVFTRKIDESTLAVQSFNDRAIAQLHGLIEVTQDVTRIPKIKGAITGRDLVHDRQRLLRLLDEIDHGDQQVTRFRDPFADGGINVEEWSNFATETARFEALQQLAEAQMLPQLYFANHLYFYGLREHESRMMRSLYYSSQGFLSVWKTAVLPFRLAFTVRNIVDNFVKALMEGLHDPRLIYNAEGKSIFEMGLTRDLLGVAGWMDRRLGTSMRGLIERLLDWMWTGWTGDQLSRLLGTHGIPMPQEVIGMASHSLYGSRLTNAAGVVDPANPMRIVRGSHVKSALSRHDLEQPKLAARIRDVAYDLMAGRPENWQRKMVYITTYRRNLKNGMSEVDASLDAIFNVERTLFDYNTVSVFEENLSAVFPFIFFWRKNTQFWAHQLVDKPWFFTNLDRWYQTHQDSNSDLPTWMRRYVDLSPVASLTDRVPGLGWMTSLLLDGSYFDPMNYVSIAAFYRAFKEQNAQLPPDRAGWAFISGISDGFESIGLGMNPLLRTLGERAGILNRWAWRDIFPQTTLLQSFTADHLNEWFGDAGFNIEDTLLDPIFRQISNEPGDQQLALDRVHYYENQLIAARLAEGQTISRDEAGRQVRRYILFSTFVGFAIGVFPRHITTGDLSNAAIAQRAYQIFADAGLTDEQQREEWDTLWNGLSIDQQIAYRLYRYNKDNPGISAEAFDRYRMGVTAIQPMYQLPTWDDQQQYLRDHPEALIFSDPILRGEMPSDQYLAQLQLSGQIDVINRITDVYKGIGVTGAQLQTVRDALTTPALGRFFAENSTTPEWQQRHVNGHVAYYFSRLNRTYFALPEQSAARDDFLNAHPELQDFWAHNDTLTDDYRGLVNAMNGDLREVYFGFLDRHDQAGADDFLRRHPFIFDFTRAEGRVTDDGKWIPKSQAQKDYAKVANELRVYYTLSGDARRSYGDDHPLVLKYIEKYGVKGTPIDVNAPHYLEGGLDQHAIDYLRVKEMLDQYFRLPEGSAARSAYLNSHPLLRNYFAKYSSHGARGSSQHARDYLAVKPQLDRFFSLPESERGAYLASHPELKAYFAKYSHHGSGGGTSQHARDYLAVKSQLDRYFSLPEAKRGAYLADHPEVRAYFDKYSSHGAGFHGTFREVLATSPEISRRYDFWTRFLALSPDKRPAYIHTHAVDAGIFIYGSLGYKHQQDTVARWHREALALGTTDRAIAYQAVAPFLDLYFKMPEGSAMRSIFLAVNPELSYYLQHFTKNPIRDPHIRALVDHYHFLPAFGPERQQYVQDHPELERYFNSQPSAVEGALRRQIDTYFALPFGIKRDQYLAQHPEVGAYFDQRDREHQLFASLTAAFNETDPRFQRFYEMYADIIPLDRMRLEWLRAQGKHEIVQGAARIDRSPSTTTDSLRRIDRAGTDPTLT